MVISKDSSKNMEKKYKDLLDSGEAQLFILKNSYILSKDYQLFHLTLSGKFLKKIEGIDTHKLERVFFYYKFNNL